MLTFSRITNDKFSEGQLKLLDRREIGKALGIHLASLEILIHVSWIPSPIREAFLLNSDRDDAEANDLDDAGSCSA